MIGDVKLLTDREHEEPDLDIRVPGLERFSRKYPEEEYDMSSTEEKVVQKSSKQSVFSFLYSMGKSPLVSTQMSLKSPRRRTLRY